MSARDNILKAVALNKPAPAGLPEIHVSSDHSLAARDAFIVALKNIGATVAQVAGLIEAEKLLGEENQHKNIIDLLFDKEINPDQVKAMDAHGLESTYVAYLKGTLGVAENSAVWIEEPDMINRLIPFICEHLVIVLDAKNIVYTMHDAYERIQTNKYGYGVFIAGPSKTADIEQSLVIGAHGPRSLKVFLVG